MNNFFKYFLYIFLPSAIAFFALFSYFYLSEIKQVNRHRLESERLNVRMGKRAIHQEFQAVMSDLLILSKHNAFHSKQRLLSRDAFSNLQNDFLLFSEMKGVYDQIRFLNTEGQEIIRVNSHQGNSTAVPEKLLQNKGNRYYFSESLNINRKMVYVSPLDLNMERGKIEEPHKPMIRFGTPVFNAQDEKIGVVLLNYLTERLLENFSSAVANIEDQNVNDTLGHAAGDQLLREVSERIQQVVRASDTVARLGGDEFTVILNAISENGDIVRIVQLIVETLAEPFLLSGKEANIGASIGIAVFPDHGVEQTSLINNADSAMYQAKQSGRNRYCFFE